MGFPGYAMAAQAEVQQVRNERHVGDLWELALQLSARLGALQQQQHVQLQPPPPVPAWLDPHQVGRAPSPTRSSVPGALQQPIAVVPTALPAASMGLSPMVRACVRLDLIGAEPSGKMLHPMCSQCFM